jgi:transposase
VQRWSKKEGPPTSNLEYNLLRISVSREEIEGMLRMTQVNYIRYLREEEGCSISEIARRLKINWRTARQYADGEVSFQERPQRRRQSSVIGPYTEIIDAWIEEDLRMPRKQRRTAKTIYSQLTKSTGFSGSQRTVRKYVKEARKRIMDAQKEQYVRLEHFPGEAQVDFGEMTAVLADTAEKVKYSYLVLSFPYSNSVLCRVVPAENTECFLTALRDMFEEISGVPKVIWFDNLAPAVTHILKGPERKCTAAFNEFTWHYKFKANFCNPGKGNEKGHIEGKVGYVRRNWMSPIPIITTLDGFNNELKEALKNDRNRKHYEKDKLIKVLWEEDKNALLVLPREPLEIVRTFSCVANKYGEIIVDKSKYYIPPAHPGEHLFIKVHWNKLEVLDSKAEKRLYECPRSYLQKTETVNWAEQLKIFKNKPRAVEQGAYIKALPKILKEYLLVEDLSKRRERIKILISLLEEYDISRVADAISEIATIPNVDLANIKTFIEHQICQNQLQKPLQENWTPVAVSSWQPALEEYNQLYQKEMAGNE